MIFKKAEERQSRRYKVLDMLVKECYARNITAISLEASLSEIEKNREKGKRLHQKIFLAILSGLIALAVSLFFIWILGVIPS